MVPLFPLGLLFSLLLFRASVLAQKCAEAGFPDTCTCSEAGVTNCAQGSFCDNSFADIGCQLCSDVLGDAFATTVGTGTIDSGDLSSCVCIAGYAHGGEVSQGV